MNHKSDSSEQLLAEGPMRVALEDAMDLSFDEGQPHLVSLPVTPDAMDSANKVVVEMYARFGPLKGAQRHKIASDILKLALIGKHLGPEWRKILCFASPEAAGYAKGVSWVAQAAKDFDIQIVTTPLSPDLEQSIRNAQARQKMINSP